MKFPRVVPLAALSIFAALASSAFAGLGLAGARNQMAQPSQEYSQPNVIGSSSDRALLGELQQGKMPRRLMLANAACDSRCQFYGGCINASGCLPP